MIELAPRDESEGALWAATLDLADLLDGLPWTLVSAQMVTLHAFEAGETPGRTTGDLDLLGDEEEAVVPLAERHPGHVHRGWMTRASRPVTVTPSPPRTA